MFEKRQSMKTNLCGRYILGAGFKCFFNVHLYLGKFSNLTNSVQRV